MISVSRRRFLAAVPSCFVVPGVKAVSEQSGTGQKAEPSMLTLRGHHLFDLLGALATGESAHKTLGPVAQTIRARPKIPIKVVVGVDDICSPCQWWDHRKGLCTKDLARYPEENQDMLTSDRNAIRTVGLKEGDVMNADDLYRLIQRKVTKKVFAEEVCVACRLVDECKETYEEKIRAAVVVLSK